MNAIWHAKHPMPRHPTEAQRIAWHVQHARHCACRPIPPALRTAIREQAGGAEAKASLQQSKRPGPR